MCFVANREAYILLLKSKLVLNTVLDSYFSKVISYSNYSNWKGKSFITNSYFKSFLQIVTGQLDEQNVFGKNGL